MRHGKVMLTIIAGLGLALALVPGAVTGGASTTTLSIEAPAEVDEGGEFIVRVAVDHVSDFNSCNFDVTYDQAVITVTAVTGGEIADRAIAVGPANWSYIPPGPDDTGRTRVMAEVPGVPGPGVSGSGHVAEVHFVVLGAAGSSSAISLVGVAMYDYTATPIATTAVDGSVTVAGLPTTLTITTASPLPAARPNEAYSATLAATGGTPPYTWTATGLPAGLTCSHAGVISGTPTQSGDFDVTVAVTDSAADSRSKVLALKVGVAVEITTTELTGGKVGDVYSATLAATGGEPPYTWTAAGLPAGLTCSADGVISGTPVGAAGDLTITVTVTDDLANTRSKSLTLTISCMPGDVNMDGVVDTADMEKVRKIYFAIDSPTTCADVNGDGRIDSGDITAIRRIYFGVSSTA